ncbi:chemotaxis protein [Thalassospira sp. HJ]|uniref:PAS domain-containing protein n=1 Tax=unclassified Thalassospira TaxID=2648997 RepID=UPI0005CE3093|nr:MULTISPECIES: PAS domain-containing protein [unclassified Thalassospira]KJE35921.1 chemotaxis protein [Thalassospira sp. HJ]MBC05771.1 PAS domain S-box protein [Thalassospira sp.]|tara:strand:+ start:5187 stop:5723 length:537 start_codon:yes stop_codon:yes gene_type:complete
MSDRRDARLSGNEIYLEPDEIIVTKTDTTGKMTYGNRTFYKLAGYTEQECIGKQHNIVRHPEMPRVVFKLAWDTIKDGREIFAYVNNRSKNGDNYWVLAHMTPSRNTAGEITGFHSNRRAPDKKVIEESIVPLYDHLLKLEKSAASPKDGLDASYAYLTELLASKKQTFNEFTLSLGG